MLDVGLKEGQRGARTLLACVGYTTKYPEGAAWHTRGASSYIHTHSACRSHNSKKKSKESKELKYPENII